MAKKQKSLFQIFTSGIFKQNPTFVQFLGMCPTLAVTKTLESAIGMGVGVIFVLTFSNLIISLIRKYVPNEVRIPIYIVVIASLVTILEMFMNAYLPDLAESLGTFLSLIVVNCIILGRAEAFASKNNPVKSVFDGLGMGIGFTLGISLIATIREFLGSGTITLFGLYNLDDKGEIMSLFPNYTINLLVGSAGAFLVFGILVSQINKLRFSLEKKAEVAE